MQISYWTCVSLTSIWWLQAEELVAMENSVKMKKKKKPTKNPKKTPQNPPKYLYTIQMFKEKNTSRHNVIRRWDEIRGQEHAYDSTWKGPVVSSVLLCWCTRVPPPAFAGVRCTGSSVSLQFWPAAPAAAEKPGGILCPSSTRDAGDFALL